MMKSKKQQKDWNRKSKMSKSKEISQRKKLRENKWRQTFEKTDIPRRRKYFKDKPFKGKI